MQQVKVVDDCLLEGTRKLSQDVKQSLSLPLGSRMGEAYSAGQHNRSRQFEGIGGGGGGRTLGGCRLLAALRASLPAPSHSDDGMFEDPPYHRD